MTLPGAKLDRALGALAAPLKRFGARQRGLWLAGGPVRDALRGRPVLDADIAVAEGSVDVLGKRFADETGGAPFALGGTGRAARLLRVVVGPAHVDFTPLRARTLEDDLRARDFTINALAVALPYGREAVLLDPTGGADDLRRRRLRLCAPGAFKADPVRLWRACRIAAELRLRLDAGTARRLRTDARLARRCTPERLRDELFKLLGCGRAADALRLARRTGVLAAGLPELMPMERVRPRGGTPIRVLDHTFEAMDHLERRLRRIFGARAGEDAALAARLRGEPVAGRPRHVLLRLALLLHDIAKPATVSRTKDGRIHFFDHERLGARAAGDLMRRRLRCAESEIVLVSRLILLHLRPGYLASGPNLSARAAFRLWRDAGDALDELLLHAEADRAATHHGMQPTAARHRVMTARLLGVRRAAEARTAGPRLLTGHEVMKAFGLKPGPTVGAALRAAEEAVALGKARTRAEALQAARRALDRL